MCDKLSHLKKKIKNITVQAKQMSPPGDKGTKCPGAAQGWSRGCAGISGHAAKGCTAQGSQTVLL